MRLDKYLFEKGFYVSREKASIAIKKGLVLVDSKEVTKPSFEVTEPEITIKSELLRYVSFGGLKLERAIEYFNLDFKGKTVLDIGSSTGGFTDCALQYGASHVVSVEVGTDQMDKNLRNNPNVELYENTNITDFNSALHFDYLVADLSFVSLKVIIPSLLRFFDSDTKFVCLIKPQFEVGKCNLKGGVVKDKRVHEDVCKSIIEFVKALGLNVNNLTYSTQKGKMGNIEYLALISYDSNTYPFDLKKIINESHTI